jgi:uncharacterized protein with beta-barrel porin domain
MPRYADILARQLALLLGTTALVSLGWGGGALAACVEGPTDTFTCFGPSGGAIVNRPQAVTVIIGDAGNNTNATFPNQLTIRSNSGITVTGATTTPPSSFTGTSGLSVIQNVANTDNISITGINSSFNMTPGGSSIAVSANTSGTTTIETVAGGTINSPGQGIEYRNDHVTPGDATITVGAAITVDNSMGGVAVLVRTPNAATNTVNINADVAGGVYFEGWNNATGVLNVASGAEMSTSGASIGPITLFSMASATVTNNGTISVSGNDAYALWTNSTATLTNTATGAITATSNGWAFRNTGAGKTLTVNNAGTLTGTGSSAPGATITINNTGTWNPNRNSNFIGAATLDNSGMFNSGAFTTAITSATNSGTANIQAGGTLNTSGTYAQSAGTTTIASGSTLIASGGYSQSGGTTSVNGTLASAVALTGGTLGGSGMVIGNLNANAGSTIAPGNSIGTLTINGNASFAAGSTYRVEIVGAAADLLTVTGTASLAGTIQLVAGGGSYSFNAPYTVLTATVGRIGTFGTVTTAGSFGVGVTSEVSYGANDVKVTLKPGSLVDAGSGATNNPTTPSSNPVYGTASDLSLNGWSVAAAIDRAVANGADPSFLYQVYARGDREALLAALRTLTGEVHSATGTLGLSAASGFLTAALDPFAAGRDPNAMPNGFGAFTTSGAYASSGSAAELPSTKGMARAPRFTPDRLYTVWGQVFGSVNRTDGDRFLGTTAQNGSSGHIALGVDVRVLPDTVIGVAFGAGEARTSLSGQLGSAKAEILQAGLYGVTRIGALSLGAALGYASADTETTRVIPLLAAFAVKGKYRAEIWSGRAEAAYRLASIGPLALSPYGAFTAQSLHTPAFVERDSFTGLPAGLAVTSRTATTSRAELGLRLDATTTLFGVPTAAFGKLGWGYYAQRDARFSASLIGLPGSGFSFDGARPDRNAALISAGLDIRFSPAVSLGARFDSELSRNAQSYAGAATLKVAF